ncbi:unnamed protein product [Pleuronectes platessa]|uniref:Uncharacterized protein n=1 Tax=Pleuronectes platessa TaxID=8262 RepID=A0A9N7VR53_PLEPL|nr:unnamed protein product [Pleuronectes platessa]
MTGAVAAPNPVWGHRDSLQSGPEDEEVGGQRTIAEPREREEGPAELMRCCLAGLTAHAHDNPRPWEDQAGEGRGHGGNPACRSVPLISSPLGGTAENSTSRGLRWVFHDAMSPVDRHNAVSHCDTLLQHVHYLTAQAPAAQAHHPVTVWTRREQHREILALEREQGVGGEGGGSNVGGTLLVRWQLGQLATDWYPQLALARVNSAWKPISAHSPPVCHTIR